MATDEHLNDIPRLVQGSNSVPPDQEPTIRETNIVHLCWDIMVGFGTLLFLLAVW